MQVNVNRKEDEFFGEDIHVLVPRLNRVIINQFLIKLCIHAMCAATLVDRHAVDVQSDAQVDQFVVEVHTLAQMI